MKTFSCVLKMACLAGLGFSAFAADPTGAVEFDVTAPNNPKGAVVRAVDFGVSPASTNNSPALQAAIDHCKRIGASRLVLDRGRYRFTSDGQLDFVGLQDFTFDGGGSDFVFFHKKGANIQLQSCHRIVLRDFSIDWDWERDPLGSIVEIAAKDDKSVTFRFVDYENFPRKDVRCAFMSPWDKATREVGYPDMDNGFSIDMSWGGPIKRPPREWLSGNVLRVDKPIDYHYVKPGALFRMNHYYYDMHNFIIASTTHLKLENVEVKSNPGHAFIVDGTSHHCHFKNVNIRLPKDDPKRGVTCTADHFHVNRSKGFLKFENCEFSLGGDDCMNLHDCSMFAPERLDDYTLRVKRRSRIPFAETDEVELRYADFRPTGIRCNVKTKVLPEGGGYDITFPVRLPAKAGDGFLLFDRTSSTRNIILRNCWFHGNRSRGFILAASDVTMEDCRISHTEGPGMILSTGWTYKLWCEGSGVSNVVVRNCRFDRCNVAHRPRNGVVADIVMDSYVRWPGHAPEKGYPVFEHILFENNVFTDPSGYVASVREGSGVVFRKTKIVTTFEDRFAPDYRGEFRAVPATSLVEEGTVRENRVKKDAPAAVDGRGKHSAEDRKAISSRKTVLLLGDSIRMGYCADVKALMKGRADVYYPAENCMFSYYTLRMVSDWVRLVPDPKKVDVVHFNNGLWDLGQRDGRECLTPIDIYAATEARVADELRHYFPNAKLVFATTTPINEAVSSLWHTKGNAEVERYNAAAIKALTGKVDAIDDLYAFVRDNKVGRFYQDIVHYRPEGSRLLAEQVIHVIDGM